jgi:hypothetical protein
LTSEARSRWNVAANAIRVSSLRRQRRPPLSNDAGAVQLPKMHCCAQCWHETLPAAQQIRNEKQGSAT